METRIVPGAFSETLEAARLRAGRLVDQAADAADTGNDLEAARLYNRAAAELVEGMKAAQPLFDSAAPDVDLQVSLFLSDSAMVKALTSCAWNHFLRHAPVRGNA